MKRPALKTFDTIALLKDFPDKKVVSGQVGTIVEVLQNGFLEVEFADKSGETIAEFAIHEDELMLLYYSMEVA